MALSDRLAEAQNADRATNTSKVVQFLEGEMLRAARGGARYIVLNSYLDTFPRRELFDAFHELGGMDGISTSEAYVGTAGMSRWGDRYVYYIKW
jgi:hypothetical protein